jgi:Dihydroorotase and related cyclic amidohydrolases
MVKKIFYNARIIDPSESLDCHGSLIINNDKVLSIEEETHPKITDKNIEQFNCKKKILCPGIIDIGVSIGEPGYEYKRKYSLRYKSSSRRENYNNYFNA